MASDRVRHRSNPPVKAEPVAGTPATHTHEVPERALRPRDIALVLLFVMVCALGVKNWNDDRRVAELEEYVAAAREARDAREEQLEELTRELVRRQACGFLDRLPAGPLWDPVREENGCGSGLDPAAFSPYELEQLARSYGVASWSRTTPDLIELVNPGGTP